MEQRIGNRFRSSAALKALENYCPVNEDANEESPLLHHEESLVDLLTDLRHLAASYGFDFDRAVETSHQHYLDESAT